MDQARFQRFQFKLRLTDMLRVFYADPVNEAAYQDWKKKRAVAKEADRTQKAIQVYHKRCSHADEHL